MRLRNAREFLGRYAQRKDGVVGAVILLVFAVLALALLLAAVTIFTQSRGALLGILVALIVVLFVIL